MNEKRFDHLTRTVAASRRVLVSGALVASAMALSLAGGEAGRKRGRKKGGKSGKGKPNAYGCLNLGKTCRRMDSAVQVSAGARRASARVSRMTPASARWMPTSVSRAMPPAAGFPTRIAPAS